jgi:segregation and condensation protein A
MDNEWIFFKEKADEAGTPLTEQQLSQFMIFYECLIEKNKVNIFDIPIVEITEQYLAYVKQMETEDLGTMSEFMVMASELISIKCRMLLPPETDEEGEEIDPRAELVAQLLEYKTYKYMSYELRDRMDDAAKSLYKPDTTPKEVLSYRPEVNLDELVADITLAKLHEIFDSVLRRQTEKIDPVRSQFGTIKKEEVRLADKLVWVADTAKKKKRMSFRNLLAGQRSKVQVIVTFLAMLELMKYGIVEVTQEETAGDIMIEYVPGADISAVNLENDFGEAGGESLE